MLEIFGVDKNERKTQILVLAEHKNRVWVKNNITAFLRCLAPVLPEQSRPETAMKAQHEETQHC